MADFTLDTSGEIETPSTVFPTTRVFYTRWPDLSPFEQGYAEALLRELQCQRWALYRASCAASPGNHLPVPIDPAYRWLAAETLAAIRKDCAARRQNYADLKLFPLDRDLTAEDGRHFYERRQSGDLVFDGLRPLTFTLGDDGRVYLREAA